MKNNGTFEILPSIKRKFYVRYKSEGYHAQFVYRKACRTFDERYDLCDFSEPYEYFTTREQAKKAIDSIIRRWEKEKRQEEIGEMWCLKNPPEIYP